MSNYLYRLARFAFRRRRLVLAAWLAAAIAAIAIATISGGKTNDNFTIPGTEAQNAAQVLAARLPAFSGGQSTIVFATTGSSAKVTDPAARAAIETAMSKLKSVPQVAAVVDPFQGHAVSQGGQVALGQVQWSAKAADVKDASLNAVKDAMKPVQADGVQVEYNGSVYPGWRTPVSEVPELAGLIIAFGILMITFGAFAAAGLPILSAIIGVVTTLMGITAVASVLTIASASTTVALMLGLSCGIDYGLFILSRHRANLLNGMIPEESVPLAVGTAGSSVVFAALTVIIALCGLTVVGIPFLTVMGLAAAASVTVALLIALTLLPAMLGFAGPKVARFARLPLFGARAERVARRSAADPDSSAGAGWARFVVRHRVPVLLGGIALLGVLAIPAASIHLGLPSGASQSADNTQRKAYDLTTEGFGAGYNGPLLIVAQGVRSAADTGADFGAVERASRDSWNAALSKIHVAGGANARLVTFYTALYHSLLHPNVTSDVNGQYMGFDAAVHTVATVHAEYANYSGWDIYRSETQLESMLFPRQASDMTMSMLDDYDQTGMLPKWNENSGESYVMVGDPADPIIADAYAFGARDFNAGHALADMETEATVPGNIRPGLSYYFRDGYLPSDGRYGCCNYYGPVSTQEEYNAADNAIAELAAALHKTSVARVFAARANNWQNVYNPASGFLQPKLTSGQFQPGFKPTNQTGFVEADAYIYAAELPFDLRGLIAAEGGDANWMRFLDRLTANVSSMGPAEIQMDNEPSFNIPWEYDYTGAPYKTQAVVREIQDELYTNAPGGLAGNDDLGAMSSWYVWSAIGGYPETPGIATVAIGSPMFRSITIHLGDGKVITETAPKASSAAPFVHGLTLNGASYSRAYLPASLFFYGGTLDWTLAAKPDQFWASAAADAPPSNTSGLLPALGYASIPGRPPGASSITLTTAPGLTSGGTVTLGVRGTSGPAQQVNWMASVSGGSGLQVNPPNGTFTVAAGTQDSTAVQLRVPSHAPGGHGRVTFALTTAAGVTLPPVTVGVQVQAPPSRAEANI